MIAIKDPAQPSCFQHSLVALGGISNNFLYARSANNLGTSSLPSLTWQTNWFSRERHSILLFYRRELGGELPATTNIFLKKCASLISSNFFGGVCSQRDVAVPVVRLFTCGNSSSFDLRVHFIRDSETILLIRFFTHFLFRSVCTLFTSTCGNDGRVHA